MLSIPESRVERRQNGLRFRLLFGSGDLLENRCSNVYGFGLREVLNWSRRQRPPRGFGVQLSRQFLGILQHQQLARKVLQFADIPGPVVQRQCLPHLRSQNWNNGSQSAVLS